MGARSILEQPQAKCRFLLTQVMQFVGRFELVGSSALRADLSVGLKKFDALHFGGATSDAKEGRRVTLKRRSLEERFQSREVRALLTCTARLVIDSKHARSHQFLFL